MPQTTRAKNGQQERGGTALVVPEHQQMQTYERWQPFGDFDQIADRMRRMLEQTFGEVRWPSLTETAGWSPLVDIEEQDDAYLVEAELPGVKRQDVDVEVVGNELTITGELKETDRKGVVRKRTRRTGQFNYRVALPQSVDPDKVEAKLTDGVLSIRIPKIEKAMRKQVQIK